MYWLCTFIILGVIGYISGVVGSFVSYYKSKKLWKNNKRGYYKPDSEFVWFTAVMGLPITGLVVLLLSMLGNALGLLWTHDVAYQSAYANIRALQDGQTTHGSFFLGSGSIDSKPVYYYYYEVSPGRYKQGWVESDATEIVESADVTPHLEGHNHKSSDPNWCWWRSDNVDDEKFTFYVPNGTIVPGYVLNTSAQ